MPAEIIQLKQPHGVGKLLHVLRNLLRLYNIIDDPHAKLHAGYHPLNLARICYRGQTIDAIFRFYLVMPTSLKLSTFVMKQSEN